MSLFEFLSRFLQFRQSEQNICARQYSVFQNSLAGEVPCLYQFCKLHLNSYSKWWLLLFLSLVTLSNLILLSLSVPDAYPKMPCYKETTEFNYYGLYTMILMDYGLWTMDYGLWTMDYGLWTIYYILYTMDYILYTMDYGLWTKKEHGQWIMNTAIFTMNDQIFIN